MSSLISLNELGVDVTKTYTLDEFRVEFIRAGFPEDNLSAKKCREFLIPILLKDKCIILKEYVDGPYGLQPVYEILNGDIQFDISKFKIRTKRANNQRVLLASKYEKVNIEIVCQFLPDNLHQHITQNDIDMESQFGKSRLVDIVRNVGIVARINQAHAIAAFEQSFNATLRYSKDESFIKIDLAELPNQSVISDLQNAVKTIDSRFKLQFNPSEFMSSYIAEI